jgi:hypothetical protein
VKPIIAEKKNSQQSQHLGESWTILGGERGNPCTSGLVLPQGCARYGISVGVNPKTNVGLGVPRAGTSNQKAMRNEKAFTKRLNLPPS